MQLDPIETRYRGHRFRSRLEARWAIFLDRLAIQWEYEPEGYVIDGRPYLPDFKLRLPGNRVLFAEVKHSENDEHAGEHVELCRGLADATECPVVLLVGPPAYRMYHQFTPGLDPDAFTLAFFTDYGPLVQTADPYWFAQIEFNEATGAPELPHDAQAARKSFGAGFVYAIEAARSARFEHGVQP